MTIPMLADFALRLACGLAALLLLTPWRQVPPRFFRTHCLVILGLLSLAFLDVSRFSASGPLVIPIVAAATLTYFATVTWGLGLVRLGSPLTVLILAACAGDLVAASQSLDPAIWRLNAAVRLASAFLMGATLTAMLLGHHYLTAPAMSIDPLKRFVRMMAWGLSARSILAAIGLGMWIAGFGAVASSATVSPMLVAVRWGMGVLGPAVATVLTWQTVQIRSTQSATGILYIAMTLVLFGELTAMILSSSAGIHF
jgi:hypothetical protein